MKISQAIYAGSSTRVSRKPGRKLPEFAFIGRSNVGKSSLINMLCGKSKLALTSATPGKTKVVNHFLVNDKWYLVDLPGYGYAKMSNKGREELTAVISDYILNSQEMVMLFVLVDSRYEITARDLDFISNLGQNRIPFGIVFTKCDKMGPNALKAVIDKDCEILSSSWEQLPPMFTTSSRTAAGKEEILSYIDTILASL
ncbi:MAG: YihA family ribosome biogenesis GTP-binding protein [Bacteroidales bacterium]|nr:YihA family ribosome biogenesis GTP-binding protein [Bacteroidales bacterium]